MESMRTEHSIGFLVSVLVERLSCLKLSCTGHSIEVLVWAII